MDINDKTRIFLRAVRANQERGVTSMGNMPDPRDSDMRLVYFRVNQTELNGPDLMAPLDVLAHLIELGEYAGASTTRPIPALSPDEFTWSFEGGSADASDLGWQPGEWPERFCFDLRGSLREYVRNPSRDEGESRAYMPTDGAMGRPILVHND